MSTIKVNSIKNTSTDDGGIAIDNSGHVQIDGQQLPTAGALSNRNLFYNGAMTVSQRGTSGTVTTAGGYPSLDRWSCNDGGIAGFTVSQSTDAPAGFANSAKWVCTSTGSATNDAFHEQKLEGQDIQHLEYGTSSAKSITISFWVKSNKTGEYSLWIENNDAARYFTTPGYTINAANTWEFKTITVPGDTGGSGFSNDNGISLKVRWHLVLRTSFQGTPPGTWSTSASLRGQGSHVNFADSTSNEWYITGVQLEVGEKATPFEHRSFGDELAKCQRYFQTSFTDNPSTTNTVNVGIVMAGGGATGNTTGFIGAAYVQLAPNMRDGPTITVFDLANPRNTGKVHRHTYGVAGSNNNTAVITDINPKSFIVRSDSGSSANGIIFHYKAEAEL